MAHNQHPHGSQRGYPSPSAFPSPGPMPPNQYAYHPQQNQAPADPYRASPGAPIPSLPSMKSLEHHYQQSAPQPPQAMPMPMQMAPNQGMQYYLPPGVQSNPYMTQDLNHLRYQIPHGHDPRLMRGPGGPKKNRPPTDRRARLPGKAPPSPPKAFKPQQVKPQVKPQATSHPCDEAHPSCNNCKKSKRECLGYDPIFKQQPGPSVIQPAPNAQRVPTPTIPSVPSSVPPPVPTVPSTAVAPQVPVPVAPSNPYGNQPAVLPSSYNPPVASSHAPLDPALNSAASGIKPEPTYDFAAPIDPALQNLPAPATLHSTQTQSFSGEQRAGFDNHLRATRMKVDDLIGLLGPAAPTQEIALTPELLTEIINVYREVYAVGLQSFFEANYFQKQDAQGKFAFEHSQQLLRQFASFLKIVQSVPANDHTQMTHSGYLCYYDPAKRDEVLGKLRMQLGGRENRDLIYSIAISRELSPRVEVGFERNVPQHMDESDPKNRLFVANKFIQDEAQVTGGTTNVVRRFGEIAIRAYISPGVNIAAHPHQAAPAQP
ncbi:hypothetical protein CSAL01_10861 [Colletotrichum salicis]|uniref:Zn(2)-C6 fungal-type domain-containing protein n=1 Tax=Colletotrichum salicis TaxID=1209931 RepID=A0A135V5W3_9PEZI|nr:hypothetical protein CSAL01_10861 [Colletotrichum salicis]